MLRSLLPTTLALLLLPSAALAAPAPAASEPAFEPTLDGPLSADVSGLSQAPDQAERSMRRSRGGGSSKGSGNSGEAKKEGGGSRQPASRGGSRSGGSGSGGSGSGESSRGERRESGSSGERRDDGPTARPTPAPAPRSEPDGGREAGREGGRDTGREGGREDAGSRTARPAPYGSDGGTPRPDAARPSGASGEGRERTVRTFDGARPAPTATRRVSAGAPTSASGRPAASGEMRGAAGAPANFRGVSSSRTAVSGRGEAGRGEAGRGDADGRSEARDGRDSGRHGDGGRDGHESAERHGGRGSDAERASYGSRGASDRRHEEVRHARSTAAYHRSSAAYHRSSAAARHHAYSSRYGRGYRSGAWFRPYRPGHAYWYHGVFVYGPSPWHHHHHTVVVERDGGGHGGERAEASEAPVRKVERARTFAVGIRGGSYMGGYNVGGDAFGDAGLGIAARYRPVEAVGLEVSWMHHDQTWDDGSERVYQPLQASVQLFGMPWTKVNPYVLAGVTVTGRSVNDNLGFTTVAQDSTLWGPHAGVGLELGVGKKASVNFDVRYTGYLNKPENDLTVPGAVQGNMGLNFYF